MLYLIIEYKFDIFKSKSNGTIATEVLNLIQDKIQITYNIILGIVILIFKCMHLKNLKEEMAPGG